MKAPFFTLAFESRLTIPCPVIGFSLPRYCPFGGEDNPLIFSWLRSDSPLLFILLIYMPKWWCLGHSRWLPGSWNFLRSHLNVGRICVLAVTVKKLLAADNGLGCALSYLHLRRTLRRTQLSIARLANG